MFAVYSCVDFDWTIDEKTRRQAYYPRTTTTQKETDENIKNEPKNTVYVNNWDWVVIF